MKKFIKICLSVLICLTVLPTATLLAEEVQQTTENSEPNEIVEEGNKEITSKDVYEYFKHAYEEAINKRQEQFQQQTEQQVPEQEQPQQEQQLPQQDEQSQEQPQQQAPEQTDEQVIEQDDELKRVEPLKPAKAYLNLYDNAKKAYGEIKEDYKEVKTIIRRAGVLLIDAIEQGYDQIKSQEQTPEKKSIDIVAEVGKALVGKIAGVDITDPKQGNDLLAPIIKQEIEKREEIKEVIEEVKNSEDKGKAIKEIVKDTTEKFLNGNGSEEEKQKVDNIVAAATAMLKVAHEELLADGNILKERYVQHLHELASLAENNNELDNEIVEEIDEDVDYGYVEFNDKDEFNYNGNHQSVSFTLYNVDEYEVKYYTRGTFGLMDEVDETILPGKYAIKVKYTYTIYEDLIPKTVETVRVKNYEINKANVTINWPEDIKRFTYDGNSKQIQVTLDGLIDYADYPTITYKQVIIGKVDKQISEIKNAGTYVVRAVFNDEFYDKYNVINEIQTLIIDKVKVCTIWDESFWQYSAEIDREYSEQGYTIAAPQFKILKNGQYVDPEELGFDIVENFSYTYTNDTELIELEHNQDAISVSQIGDYIVCCLLENDDFDYDNFIYPQDNVHVLHIKQGEFAYVWPENDLDVMYDGTDKLEAIRQDIYYRIGDKEYKGEDKGQIDFYLVDDDGNSTLLDGELSAPGTYKLQAQAIDHLDQTQMYDRRYLYIHDEGYVIDYSFDDLTYNGQFQKPVPKFTYNGQPITISEDLYHVYIVKEVTGEKIATVAKNAGQYKAIVRFKDGKHILKDEDVRYFNINKKEVEIVLNQEYYEYSGWFVDLDIDFEGILEKDRKDIYFYIECLDGNDSDVGEHSCVVDLGSDEKYPKVKHYLRYIEDKTGWQIVDTCPCLNDTYQNYELVNNQISYIVYEKMVYVNWLNTCKEYTGEVLTPDYEIDGIIDGEDVNVLVETYPEEAIEPGYYEVALTLQDGANLACNYQLVDNTTIFLVVEQGSHEILDNVSVGTINLSGFVNNAKLKVPTLDEIYALINTGDLPDYRKDELLYALEDNLDIHFYIVIEDVVDDSNIKYPKNHNSSDTLLLDIKMYVNVEDSLNTIELHDLGDYNAQIELLLNEQGAKKLTIGTNRTYFERRIHNGEIVDTPIPTPIKSDAGYVINFVSNKYSIFGFYSRPNINPNNDSPTGYHPPVTGIK